MKKSSELILGMNFGFYCSETFTEQRQSQLHTENFINKIFMVLFKCLYQVHHSFQGSWKDETVIYAFDLSEIQTKSILHFQEAFIRDLNVIFKFFIFIWHLPLVEKQKKDC